MCSIAGMISLCTEVPLFAQEKAAVVSVPFIGCKSDGQVGPMDAPKGASVPVALSAKAAEGLAYYRSAQEVVGVLGPRGWYCFGTYGSDGEFLFVSPQPIDTAHIFSPGSGLAGPAIAVSHLDSDTSGRFTVAEIIARVFPDYKAFVAGVVELFDLPANMFTFGPYPGDTLSYKSKTVVEYHTPAKTEGLGTRRWLKTNGSPIDGVAILIGQPPDLLLLSVRLPAELTGLAPVIIRQVEDDAEHFGN
jgi:hypothetical protein